MHTKLPIVAALAVFALFPAIAVGQPCDPADLFEATQDYDVGESPQSVAMGDLNNDGVADLALVTVPVFDDSVRVLFNNGDGTFATPVEYQVHAASFGVAIGDLDGDGDDDVVATHAGDDSISVLLNDGAGGFAPYVRYGVGEAPTLMAIGDLDGDGAPDLATANFGSNNVSVLLNNGDGTFAPRVDYVVGDEPYAVAIGDVDGDGAPDLGVANANAATINVLFNNGDGTFAPGGTSYDVGGEQLSVAIGDLDGDGDGDLVAARHLDGIVSVLLNNGDGTFAPQVDYATPGYPHMVAIGDLNSDGVPDLATVNLLASASNRVRVMVGHGDGTFAPHANYPAGRRPVALALGDLNGDGVLDLATANREDDNASVLLNRCVLPPVILTQPAAAVLLPAGGGVAEFGVVAGGTGTILYQWRRDGVDLADGGGVSGATSPMLTIDATIDDVGAFDVVVTNAIGDTVSEPGVLAVRPNPCPADFDGDGSLTLFDFLAFQNAFVAGCP